MGLSKSSIESLQATYGESVTAADIHAWCAMTTATIRLSLTNCLITRLVIREWNLTIQEKLEQTYGTSAMPVIEQNLILQKDDSFVKFGNFGDVKKLLSPCLLPFVYHGSLRQR